MQSQCPLPPITQDNDMFEFQCLLKHNHFITKFGLHRASLEFLWLQQFLTHNFSHFCLPYLDLENACDYLL